MVKNLLTMQKTRVRSLGRKDPLEKGIATHSSILVQYFGHLMRRADLLEKTLMLGKIEGGRRGGRQRMRWLDGTTDSVDALTRQYSLSS